MYLGIVEQRTGTAIYSSRAVYTDVLLLLDFPRVEILDNFLLSLKVKIS